MRVHGQTGVLQQWIWTVVVWMEQCKRLHITYIIRNSSICKTSDVQFARTHLKTLNVYLWVWGRGKAAEYRLKGNKKEKLVTGQ